MKTVKFLCVAFFALIVSTNLNATTAIDYQDNQQLSAFEIANFKTGMMKDILNLSADQESKIQSINYFCAQMQIEQLHLKQSVSPEVAQTTQIKVMMKALSDQHNLLIKSVLTPEQYIEYSIWQGYDVAI